MLSRPAQPVKQTGRWASGIPRSGLRTQPKEPEVQRYQVMFHHRVAKALGPEESISLIAEIAAELI